MAIKEKAKIVIEKLPQDADWEDIIYSLHIQQKIEEGLTDVKNGNVVSHEEVLIKYSIQPI